MSVSTLGKRNLTVILLTMFLTLSGRICLADDAGVEQLIISAVEKFEEVADYTCRLDSVKCFTGLTIL